MAVPPTPFASRAPSAGPHPSAIALLADRTNRAIVASLGDARGRALTTTAITELAPLDVTARLVRDRLRDLDRGAILSTAHAGGGQGTGQARWTLTAAGEDLYRLHSLITRIVSHGARLPATARSTTREHVVELALSSLADPAVVQIARCLAEHGPLEPTRLEELCPAIPRRTLYRRLGPLVTADVVLRRTSGQVPRRTQYELSPRWRPAAAIVLLSGWWEARHRSASGHIEAFDLEGLVLSVLPSIRVPEGPRDAGLRWVVEDESAPLAFGLAVVGDRIRVGEPHRDAEPTMTGTPAAWSSALVTDRRDALTMTGDGELLRAVFTGVRSALLAYVR